MKNAQKKIELHIVGNKIDLKENIKFEYSEARAFAEKNNLGYSETSAKTGAGIEDMMCIALSKGLEENEESSANLLNNTQKQKGDVVKPFCLIHFYLSFKFKYL
jgi:tRNA U34 5-carboxymethylaminomethyl modifying GTPase MnmE/TrmE